MQKIYKIIDVHWAEICNSLPLIEELSEDSSFPAADLAAAIASKCFYRLQEYSDAFYEELIAIDARLGLAFCPNCELLGDKKLVTQHPRKISEQGIEFLNFFNFKINVINL